MIDDDKIDGVAGFISRYSTADEVRKLDAYLAAKFGLRPSRWYRFNMRKRICPALGSKCKKRLLPPIHSYLG